MSEHAAATDYDPFARDEDHKQQRAARELRAARAEHERWSLEHSRIAHMDRDGGATWIAQKK